MLRDIHLGDAWHIVRRIGLLRRRGAAVLTLYFVLTIANAVFDALGIVLLVALLTGRLDQSTSRLVALPLGWLRDRGYAGEDSLVGVVIVLFALKIVVSFAVLALDGVMTAYVRRRLQEQAVSAILHGQWETLRGMRTGSAVAALTEEATLVTRYLTSAVKTIYFVLGAFVLGSMALLIDWRIAMALAAVGVPCVVLLRRLFGVMSRLSKRQTIARQGFAADISERLNNLLHVKVSGNIPAYLESGLRRQRELAGLEIVVGCYQALVDNFNTVLVVAALSAFYAWHIVTATPMAGTLPLLAGVGALGARATTQVNGAIALLGNLSRFAGCLLPVRQLLDTPPETRRTPIGTAVAAVEMERVSYRHDGRTLLDAVSARAAVAEPLAIRGPSGSGKTTLANLVAGLLAPSAGAVTYVDVSGSRHDAARRSIRVGYVTQDIFLFHGTIRENLDVAASGSDSDLWSSLDAAGAAGFVRRLGGLDAPIAEAGRSLSGGEKRRLGIARALAHKPDLLILDEITAGLDAERRQEILAVVDDLAQRLVTIVITHEATEFAHWRTLTLASAAAATDRAAGAGLP
jgi:ABC-type multidrug transport system fused ATPase/permease subunit